MKAKRRVRRNPPTGYPPIPPVSPWVPLLGCTDGYSTRLAYRMDGLAALLVMRIVGLEGDPVLTPIFRDLARDGDDAKLRRRLGRAKPALVASGAATRVGKTVRFGAEVQEVVSASSAFGYRSGVERLVKTLEQGRGARWASAILARECYDEVAESEWKHGTRWPWMVGHATLCGYGPLVTAAAATEAARGVAGGPELVAEAFADPLAARARAASMGLRQYGGRGSILSLAGLAAQMQPRADVLGYQRPVGEVNSHLVMTIQTNDTTDTTWYERMKDGTYDGRLSGAIRAVLDYPATYDAVMRADE